MGRHTVSNARSVRRLLFVVAAVGVLIATVAILVINLGSGRQHRNNAAASPNSGATGQCRTTLRVVSSASYRPVLDAAATALASGPNCVHLAVTTADGRSAAQSVAATDADVWIPDDASWESLPNTLKLAARGGATLATSPFYLVSQQPLPLADRNWIGLSKALDNRQLQLRISDPAASGIGMVGVGEMSTAVFAQSGPLISALQLMRAWQHGSTVPGTQAATPTNAGQVAIMPEYQILRSGVNGHDQIVAPQGGVAILRYSWYPTASGQKRAGAGLQRLFSTLTGGVGTRALGAAQLRAPSWDSGAPPAPPNSYLPTLSGDVLPVLSQHFMWHVLTTWSPAQRAANVLVVVDVSGSMADPAPGTKTPLIALVRQGMQQLTALMPNGAEVGLWQFGSQLNGTSDYQTLVPTAPLLAAQRAALATQINGLQAHDTGTGLYDTILAAYRYQQAHFRADIPTEVIVFTDGVNQDDPQTISLSALKAGLAAADPAKRVQIGIFGFGKSIPQTALTNALAPVGGQVDLLTSSDEVVAAFVHAVSGGLTQ